VSEIVLQLGPLGVFLLMVPESACVPVPSEVTLMCAGFAVRSGWMPFWAAVLAATAGNLVGSLIAYGVGRLGRGRDLGPRAGRALSSCEHLFDRHGDRAVFVARLLPLARTFVSLPAGFARVGFGRFVAMTAAGCAIWAVAFVLLGILVGSGWAALAGPLGAVLLVLAVLGAGAWLLLNQRRARTRH
jgi:membrane protein DedA with SNARE-associated domain